MNILETEVLQLIGESTSAPDVYSDITPVRDSINAAIAELCMVTGSYTRTYHLPLYLDRHFYRMGWGLDEFGYVLECWDVERKLKLRQTDMATMAKTSPWFLRDAGNPDRYFHVGQSFLGFDRSPSASGKVLEIKCVCIPKAYTDDVTPIKVRAAFQRAAVYYAVAEYHASRGDAGRATENLNKYLEVAGIMSLHPKQPEREWVQQTEKTGAARGDV